MRTTDHLSVYTMELIAIVIALEWLENNKDNALIAFDSCAALASIKSVKSCRLDIIFRIHHFLYKLHSKDLTVPY